MRRVACRILALLLLAGAGLPASADEDLPTLVDALGGSDAGARSRAWQELVRRQDPAALPLLRKAIPAWEHTGRYYGLLVLDRYPRRTVRRTWKKLFQTDAPFVRVWSGMALLRAGDADVAGGIAEALQAKDVGATIRYRMLSRVGWPRDARLRDAVRANLERGAPIPVLVQVLSRLHGVRDREAIPRIRGLLRDPRPGVRALAAAWLYDAGDTRQAKTLAENLRAGVGYAEFLQISRILAANRRVADGILDAVVQRASEETNPTLLLQQIAFLGQHRYAQARPVLRRLLHHRDDRVSRAAFDVLVTLAGPLREDTIGPLLAGADVDKRLWAAEALRQRDDHRGLQVVAAILRSGTVPQRVGAAGLLASFTSDDAVEPLLDALADAHLDVRKAALTGLARLVRRLFPYRAVDLGLTGYAPGTPQAQRAAAIATIRAWWRGVRGEDW